MRGAMLSVVVGSILLAISAPLTAQETSPEDTAIKAAALDYIEGYFSGDADRMTRALHPELTKVIVMAPQQGMNAFTRKMTATELIELARSKRGVIPREQWGIEVTVLDVHGNMSAVKIVNPKFIDYLQLAKVDGSWKIVNVLWGYPEGPAKR